MMGDVQEPFRRDPAALPAGRQARGNALEERQDVLTFFRAAKADEQNGIVPVHNPSSRRIVSRDPVSLTITPLGPGLHIAGVTARQFMDGLHQRFGMANRRVGQDPVPEIENMPGPSRRLVQDAFGLPADLRNVSEEDDGV